MPGAIVIQPDSSFIRDIVAHGGGDLKKCYQCATCSVICDLSPDSAPFPRRQMIQAQWGMKARLAGDPSLWLCHNCGSCTTHCPRGARPGDVMSALRAQAIRYFAFPGFMGTLVASPKAWPVLFLIPALIFLSIALWVPKGPATPELEYANVFPIAALEILFFAIAGIVVLAWGAGVARFVRAAKAAGGGDVLPGVPRAVAEVLTGSRISRCELNRNWRNGHLLTVWGFAGLGIMGTIVGMGSMAGLISTPLAMTHPLKVFANVCAGVIVVGGLLLLAVRYGDPARRAASTSFDWFFLWVLTGVIFTGVLAQFLRLGQIGMLMYPVYFIHLVLIFALFLYAPYSKFAHLVYRTVALASTKPWKQERVVRTIS